LLTPHAHAIGSIWYIEHFRIRTCFRVENGDPNVTLIDIFSAGVGPIRMSSFVPIWHRGCTVRRKEVGQKKSAHHEISEGSRSGKSRKSRHVLTFFDRSFCLFWETIMGPRGEKTASENIPHSLRKVVRQGLFFTHFWHHGSRHVWVLSKSGLFPGYTLGGLP